MAEDLTLAANPSPWATEAWWAARRLRYNIGLLIAGPLGFIGYAACTNLRAPGNWDITIFTTLFHGLAYLVMVGIANLCYYLGPWSERIIQPTNIAECRKIAFQLGV